MKQFILRHKFVFGILAILVVGLLCGLIGEAFWGLNAGGIGELFGHLLFWYLAIGLPIKISNMVKERKRRRKNTGGSE